MTDEHIFDGPTWEQVVSVALLDSGASSCPL